MGRWLEEKSSSFCWGNPKPPICSECGEFALAFTKTPFCPWCGKPMEVEEKRKNNEEARS